MHCKLEMVVLYQMVEKEGKREREGCGLYLYELTRYLSFVTNVRHDGFLYLRINLLYKLY